MPPELARLVERLLEREPARRPASGEEVLVELSPMRDTESSPLARRTVLLRQRVPTSTLVVAALTLVVVAGFVIRLQWNARPLGPEAPVVAVSPLTNSSGDAANDYLGAGLAESLITSLASVPRVTVLSRSAVEESRQQNPDHASFVRSLDASYIVTGSVQSGGDRLHVTLNLERPDASVAWGETVEGPVKDLFALQTRLATSLGNAIADQTPSGQRVAPAALTTTSEPAQLAYWRGRAQLDRRELTGSIQAALKEFSDAVALDPRFAVAHAGLAEAQWAMYAQTNDKTWAERAMTSTTTAIGLEPERPSVRYTAALTLFRSGRFQEANAEVDRALALQPTYEEAIRLHASAHMRSGEVDRGLAEFQRLIAIRPSSVSLFSDMGLALYTVSRFPKEALDAIERAVASGIARNVIADDEDFALLKPLPRFTAVTDVAPGKRNNAATIFLYKVDGNCRVRTSPRLIGAAPGYIEWTVVNLASDEEVEVEIMWPKGGPWGGGPLRFKGNERKSLAAATPGRYKYNVTANGYTEDPELEFPEGS
ncbi:MAG: hypothetical protein EXQ50_06465 [Acidobacteria bacterium]|nr:hypothetical protein [Acidobacteriota bacterium]